MTVQLHPHRRRFQSTLPREERPSLYLLGAHLHNFNPRSHERSDSQQSELITMLRISIHAPTRGATHSMARITPIHTFQSTLPREERLTTLFQNTGSSSISIHAPTRGATKSRRKFWPEPGISIHAPTRGATILASPFSSSWKYFNPRSHERSDKKRKGEKKKMNISIHAPTRGATFTLIQSGVGM